MIKTMLQKATTLLTGGRNGRLLLLTAILITGFLTSCNDEWYDVPASTEHYVEAFDQYANNHGYKFDFRESGLIIEFTDLSDDTVSRCNYEDPIRIEIDAESWQEANDNRREEIILRNLALGFLNRHNTNELFPNGEWTSIMRGRPFNTEKIIFEGINYFGFRQDYYVDELFDESTKAPWWTDYSPSYESLPINGMNIVYQEDFIDGEKDWGTNNMPLNANLNNGEMELVNNTDKPVVHIQEINYDIKSTFLVECIFKLESGNNLDLNGLVWGAKDRTSFHIAGYNMNNAISLHNMAENYTYFKFHNPSETLDNLNGYHKISIFYDEQNVFVFVDEKFIYITDVHDIYGPMLGFRIGANSRAVIDRLIVYQ
jgi:hypothetical protein